MIVPQWMVVLLGISLVTLSSASDNVEIDQSVGRARTCRLKPLGKGKDDTDQVCIIFSPRSL